ncbi:MAG: glycoside hydrolase family 127 protein [Clostridia bacterium]|nr:glycoside hydrolase family 127 protein [Clostridia bacterium]
MAKWTMFTSKELKPAGWLRRQLEIQADGLSGNLDKVWRDVRDSAWIGGDAEGWERVPYWLDGFIPLAYLLEDEDKIARAKKYIDAILAQQKESGWICPCSEEAIPSYDSWAVQLIAKVLVVYYECSGDERIPDAVYRILKNYYEVLSSGTAKLFSWGKARWFETFISLNFLAARCDEPWIGELAKILREQGLDYEKLTERWKRPLNKWTFETHIVNLAMMVKAEAVSHTLLGEAYTDQAERLTKVLRDYNGTPVGIFTGDECLSGLSPIQGTELCSVAELMYSYELLYAYTGDKKWAERLEVVAFNALAATISDDMWTHQYDQQANQIACVRFPGKAIWRTNGPESNMFGLEPSYGCCTANFNQAWPKFALAAFMQDGDTIVSAVPVPAKLTAETADVTLETNYPFENSFTYTVCAKQDMKLLVRVPAFAENLTVNGAAAEKADSLIFAVPAGETRVITVSYETKPVFVDRPYGLQSVQCGSLVFSLPIEAEWKMVEYTRNNVERKFPYCDYELIPQSDWNYAFASDELTVIRGEVGDVPFSSKNPPVMIETKMQKIDWGYEDGYDTVCAKIPESRKGIGEAQTVRLYPYACPKLRMTEMPAAE